MKVENKEMVRRFLNDIKEDELKNIKVSKYRFMKSVMVYIDDLEEYNILHKFKALYIPGFKNNIIDYKTFKSE